MGQAKRVILRLPENDMDYKDIYEPARLYFTKFSHSAEEVNSSRHFIHIQPQSDLPQPDSKIHIVIDLETEQFSGSVDHSLPHEIYAVRRRGNEM